MSSAFRRAAKKNNNNNNNNSRPATKSASAISASESDNVSDNDNNNNNNDSFVKSANNAPPQTPLLFLSTARGVKPSSGGIYLTSNGLQDLDNMIMNGGQPLQSSFYIQSIDKWSFTSLSLTLLRYWCAEGISQQQQLIIPILLHRQQEQKLNTKPRQQAELESILNSLPRNLHWDKQKQQQQQQKQNINTTQQQQQQQQQIQPHSLGIDSNNIVMEEINEEDENEEEEEDLKIAWQYSKSVQLERSGQSNKKASTTSNNNKTFQNVYCHSFDLSGRMLNQFDNNTNRNNNNSKETNKNSHYHWKRYTNFAYINLPGATTTTPQKQKEGFQFFQQLVQQITTQQQNGSNKNPVIRLVLFKIPPTILQVSLPLLMSWIRTMELPIVVLIIGSDIPLQDSSSFSSLLLLPILQQSCDYVLNCESFASRQEYPPPIEYRNDYIGLLHVSKTLSTMTNSHYANMTITKRPVANLYGFKRTKRKLHISLLHIPPEDDTNSSTGGGLRSTVAPTLSMKGGNKSRNSSGGGGLGCASNNQSSSSF